MIFAVVKDEGEWLSKLEIKPNFHQADPDGRVCTSRVGRHKLNVMAGIGD
jgi:hypothetical protein